MTLESAVSLVGALVSIAAGLTILGCCVLAAYRNVHPWDWRSNEELFCAGYSYGLTERGRGRKKVRTVLIICLAITTAIGLLTLLAGEEGLSR
jgi:hypothetical protein